MAELKVGACAKITDLQAINTVRWYRMLGYRSVIFKNYRELQPVLEPVDSGICSLITYVHTVCPYMENSVFVSPCPIHTPTVYGDPLCHMTIGHVPFGAHIWSS